MDSFPDKQSVKDFPAKESVKDIPANKWIPCRGSVTLPGKCFSETWVASTHRYGLSVCDWVSQPQKVWNLQYQALDVIICHMMS